MALCLGCQRQIGDASDVAISIANTFVPGASSILPDPPWYKTWWGLGLIGVGSMAVLYFVFVPTRPHPSYRKGYGYVPPNPTF